MATEQRLIDAMKTVTNLSKRVTPLIAQGCHPQRVYSEVLQVIAEASTLDAVEVVRCKDCKHWIRQADFCPYECQIFNGAYETTGYHTSADGFCSYGERKDNLDYDPDDLMGEYEEEND